MKFPEPLVPGSLLRRFNRFLAEIKLENGQTVLVHCPNSGSMLTCNSPGNPVMVSKASNLKRKTKYTWEMILMNGTWVGINTGIPNIIVTEAIEKSRISSLQGYTSIQREKPYGKNSRIDIFLENKEHACYVEVKNVTLNQGGIAFFPDAVTARGTKHLLELQNMVQKGHRAVMFYVVQRDDCNCFKPAYHIDPVYAKTLLEARDTGVEILVYKAKVTPVKIIITHPIPVDF